MTKKHRNKSNTGNLHKDDFPAEIFYFGVILFSILGGIMANTFWGLSSFISSIIIDLCFVCLGSFMIFYDKFKRTYKTFINDRFHQLGKVGTVISSLFLSYLFVASIRYSYLNHIAPVSFVILLIYSIFLGIHFSEKGTNTFFKVLLTVYLIISSFWILTFKIYPYGAFIFEELKQNIPVIENFRLTVSVLSSLTVVFYGLVRASEEKRPQFWMFPIHILGNSKHRNDIIFIDGLITGFQKFIMRIYSILALIMNRIIIVIGSAIFYLLTAFVKIYEETIKILSESKDLVIAISMLYFSFFTVTTAINISHDQLCYLDSNCTSINSFFPVLVNIVKLAFWSSAIVLFPLIYDTFIKVIFTTYKQGVESNKELINYYSAIIFDGLLMIGLFYTFSGWILFLFNALLSAIGISLLGFFSPISGYTLQSSLVVLILGSAYFAYQKINLRMSK